MVIVVYVDFGRFVSFHSRVMEWKKAKKKKKKTTNVWIAGKSKKSIKVVSRQTYSIIKKTGFNF